MSRRHKKGRSKPRQLLSGVLHINGSKYAHVDTPEGQFVITKGHINGAMNGDVVQIVRMQKLEGMHRSSKYHKAKRKGRLDTFVDKHEMLGSVKHVLQRANQTIMGSYMSRDGLDGVRPFDRLIDYDILIDKTAKTNLEPKDGDAVLVRMIKYRNKQHAATGYVEKILSGQNDTELQYEIIATKNHIEVEWAATALAETHAVLEAVRGGSFADEVAKWRRDLRSRLIYTIDPRDAKDFDDAISVEVVQDSVAKLRLGVHIADVSAYVPMNSSLDLEARRRASSTYFPGKVIPMLPQELSEDICSLEPGKDKLAFTVDMLLDESGAVVHSEFYPSLIRSASRLTYEQAQTVLDSGAGEGVVGERVCESLLTLGALAQKLKRRREERGALEFESVEAKVELDASGKAKAVNLRRTTPATSMIEEAMILANEQVASFAISRKSAFIYRVHEQPYAINLEEVKPTLKEFGYATRGMDQSSKGIQQILDVARGKPEHALISRLLLRAMMRAKYSAVSGMHYGLASDAYTHFTSPIRRYPDLMVHRLLKKLLYTGSVPKEMSKQLDTIADHCTLRERDSERAATEALQYKLCEYLSPRCGEVFWGVIVYVSVAGFFVREDSTTAEGMIGHEALGGDFEYDSERNCYVDYKGGRSYRLGQSVKIKLVGTDEQNYRPQFVLA